MSIFIKGMEMPKKCFGCPMVSFIGTCNVNKNYLIKPLDEEGKHPDCPVVKIPAIHGRLIDADVLINDLQGLRKLFPSTGMDYIGGVISLVQNTPTIIEAEDYNDL